MVLVQLRTHTRILPTHAINANDRPRVPDGSGQTARPVHVGRLVWQSLAIVCATPSWATIFRPFVADGGLSRRWHHARIILICWRTAVLRRRESDLLALLLLSQKATNPIFSRSPSAIFAKRLPNAPHPERTSKRSDSQPSRFGCPGDHVSRIARQRDKNISSPIRSAEARQRHTNRCAVCAGHSGP